MFFEKLPILQKKHKGKIAIITTDSIKISSKDKFEAEYENMSLLEKEDNYVIPFDINKGKYCGCN